MIEKDQIKELFANGLQDHQVQVDPALWSSVSSSIGAGAAKTGLGLLAKTLIGVAASGLVAVAVYLSLPTQNPEPKKKELKTLQEAGKPKESKEVIATQIIKPTIQTYYNNPPELGSFDINDDNLFIQDFEAQNVPETTTEEPSIATEIIRSSAELLVPVQPVQPALVNPNSISQAQIPNEQAALAHSEKVIQISLPNIFTPNGDGQNETLQIDWGGSTVEDFSIVVLDAKNAVVFKSSNPDFNWNGADLGEEKLPKGHYVYFISAVINGQKWQQSRSLQIQY